MRSFIILFIITLLHVVFSNQMVIEQLITENFSSINNLTIILRDEDFSITLNKEILNLRFFENEEKINCNLFDKFSIVCKVKNKSFLPIMFKINFETDKIIGDDNKYELKILSRLERFFLYIYLPIGFIVKEEKEQIPNNATLLSDGKRIILFFKNDNVTTFETYFTIERTGEKKEIPIQFPYSITTLIILVVIVLVLIIYLYYKKKLEKFKKEIIEVLDPNEKKVLEILLKNNPINQKKIVELTQLSKAEISKIVSSLKQRGIVDVEKRGRNNIIYLRKTL